MVNPMPRTIPIPVSAFFVVLASAFAVGCGQSGGSACLEDDCSEALGPVQAKDAPPPPGPLCTDVGREYVGLGKSRLTRTRIQGLKGMDRGRMKPFSALVTEYGRVLGAENAPELIAQSGDTFASPGPRAYAEPAANAVSLFTAYRVAFEGCLKLTGGIERAGDTPVDAKFAEAPTADVAKAQCEAWTRKFWSRAGSPEEVQACVDVAVSESLKEEQTNGEAPLDATPPRRWAYACAAVLTSTNFLAY